MNSLIWLSYSESIATATEKVSGRKSKYLPSARTDSYEQRNKWMVYQILSCRKGCTKLISRYVGWLRLALLEVLREGQGYNLLKNNFPSRVRKFYYQFSAFNPNSTKEVFPTTDREKHPKKVEMLPFNLCHPLFNFKLKVFNVRPFLILHNISTYSWFDYSCLITQTKISKSNTSNGGQEKRVRNII